MALALVLTLVSASLSLLATTDAVAAGAPRPLDDVPPLTETVKTPAGDFLGGVAPGFVLDAVLTLPGTAGPEERADAAGHPQRLLRGTADELRSILAANPGAVLQRLRAPNELAVSEGTVPLGTTAWHRAGHRGTGMKVAVVDSGFDGYVTKLGTELPGDLTARSFRTDGDLTPGTQHGTAVAEIIHDVVPDADLYLVNLATDFDLPPLVDYLIAQDVDVVNMSLGWTVGPFDGTSPVSQEVQRAVDAGIIWVNAAGNEAQNHWKGVYADGDGDRWMEFAGLDETNSFTVAAGSWLYIDMTWDGTADLDIALRDGSGSIVQWASSAQYPGSRPIESLVYFNDSFSSKQMSYSIYGYSGNAGRVDVFTASSTYGFEYNVRGGSINAPGDLTNVVTVGAADWFAPNSVASYSSRGPTVDGRIKPDILGPTSVTTASYGTGAFAGTSAAAPHVAGMAALYAAADPSLTPAGFQQVLADTADPLPGQTTKKNNAGWGFARLGPLPPIASTNCDVNGDGFGDVPFGSPAKDLEGAPDAGMLHLMFGTTGTFDPAATTVTAVHRGSHGSRPGPAAADRLGQTVVCGDFDGDGYADLAAGAPGEAVGPDAGAGAVHVVYGSAAGLTASEQVWHRDSPGVLKPAEAGDAFGAALAVGDFDGDGFDDLAVGAPGTKVGLHEGAGSLTVLYGSPEGVSARDLVLTQGMTPMPGAPQLDDGFGSALAGGDIDGDGYDDLVIGTPYEFLPRRGDVGTIDVVYGTAAGLNKNTVERFHQASRGILEDPEVHAAFGAALTIGDVDGDGYADVVVGIPAKTVNGRDDAGQAHIIFGGAGGLSRRDVVVQQGGGLAGTAQPGDGFGSSLVLGDFDKNGTLDIAVGVPGQTVGGKSEAGAVHVIYNDTDAIGIADTIWHRNSAGVPHTAISGDAFAASLAVTDIDRDGADDLIVGVPFDNIPGAVDAGTLSIFHGGVTNPLGRFADVISLDSPGVGFAAAPGDQSGAVGTVWR
jgi:hypothetical protein